MLVGCRGWVNQSVIWSRGNHHKSLPVLITTTIHHRHLDRVEATMRREEELRSIRAAQEQQATRSKMNASSGVRVLVFVF